ncbi:hypothetical protein EV121DRAFT_297769 [Schizophyllum commune]
MNPASFLATFNIRDWPRETPDILLWPSSSLERVIAPTAIANDERDGLAIPILAPPPRPPPPECPPHHTLQAPVLADVDSVAAVGQSARRCSASIENDNDAFPPTPCRLRRPYPHLLLPPPLIDPMSCCLRASCADSGSWEISRAMLVAMMSLVDTRAPRVPASKWDSQVIADGFCESAQSSTGDDEALPSRTHTTLPNRWRPARGSSVETSMNLGWIHARQS